MDFKFLSTNQSTDELKFGMFHSQSTKCLMSLIRFIQDCIVLIQILNTFEYCCTYWRDLVEGIKFLHYIYTDRSIYGLKFGLYTLVCFIPKTQ